MKMVDKRNKIFSEVISSGNHTTLHEDIHEDEDDEGDLSISSKRAIMSLKRNRERLRRPKNGKFEGLISLRCSFCWALPQLIATTVMISSLNSGKLFYIDESEKQMVLNSH